MNYLLDTHALIWAALEPEKLSVRVRRILEKPESEIFFSSVSLLEISIKYGLGKLKLYGEIDPPSLLKGAISMGFQCLDLSCVLSATLYEKKFPPGDPFDRILCHLAMENNLVILTKDAFFKKLKDHDVKHLW